MMEEVIDLQRKQLFVLEELFVASQSHPTDLSANTQKDATKTSTVQGHDPMAETGCKDGDSSGDGLGIIGCSRNKVANLGRKRFRQSFSVVQGCINTSKINDGVASPLDEIEEFHLGFHSKGRSCRSSDGGFCPFQTDCTKSGSFEFCSFPSKCKRLVNLVKSDGAENSCARSALSQHMVDEHPLQMKEWVDIQRQQLAVLKNLLELQQQCYLLSFNVASAKENQPGLVSSTGDVDTNETISVNECDGSGSACTGVSHNKIRKADEGTKQVSILFDDSSNSIIRSNLGEGKQTFPRVKVPMALDTSELSSHVSYKRKKRQCKRKRSKCNNPSMFKGNKLALGVGGVMMNTAIFFSFIIVLASITFGKPRGNKGTTSSVHMRSFKTSASDSGVSGSNAIKDMKRVGIDEAGNSKEPPDDLPNNEVPTLKKGRKKVMEEGYSQSMADGQNSGHYADKEFSPRYLQSTEPDLHYYDDDWAYYFYLDGDWVFDPTPFPSSFPPTVTPPTLSPSLTNDPTSSSIPSGTPSISNRPSSSPLPTAACMNLTVAMLLPISSFSTDVDEYVWTITTMDDVALWSITYIDKFESLTTVVDHANGTNLNKEAVCLLEGSYAITFELYKYGKNNNLVAIGYWDDAWFAVFSGDNRIKCGRLTDWGDTFQFYLPSEKGHSESSGCNSDESVPLEEEFDAFECYVNPSGNRTKWFDDKCGPLLANACSSKSPLGFNDETITEQVSYFCTYHQCAYIPFRDGIEGKYHDCDCLFLEWECSVNGDCYRAPFKDPFDCCKAGGSSCECITKDRCEDGDKASCDRFEQYCCADGGEGCDCRFLEESCVKSLESGSYQFCDMFAEVCCGEDDDTEQSRNCKCDLWEPLCTSYQGQACIYAVESCCGAYAPYARKLNTDFFFEHPHCYCDFYDYATEVLEYEFENKDVYRDLPCSQARQEKQPTPDSEQASLELLYNNTAGDFWIDNTGWLTNERHCDWYGVVCSNGQVTEILLSSNNLTGSFFSEFKSHYHFDILFFPNLQYLNLANNSLSGTINYIEFFRFRELTSVDLSKNNFSGAAEALFSPAALYVNVSHNHFSSINAYKRFKRSHETLRSFDASYNEIHQSPSEIFVNLPVNLEELVLSNNLVEGGLPDPLERLDGLRRFDISDNFLLGTIPDFQISFPNLRILNLSSQLDIAGPIPAGIFNLVDLVSLDLSHNILSDVIPQEIGKSPLLKTILLASNELKGAIPSELGNLAGIIEEFDVSNNGLDGAIPSELGGFSNAIVRLSGNPGLTNPAPLSLCSINGFDLSGDANKCSIERNALKDFFDSTKGVEWTNTSLWLDEFEHHCTWYGVYCTGGNKSVVNLTLHSNGLSGKVSESIHDLTALEVLDLGDNDIKGSIPAEIGRLTNLTYLRLSYNAFIGEAPSDLGSLHNLKLVQLHGNRLSSSMPFLNGIFSLPFSFVTDCGVPSDFDKTLNCPNCTMCCNSREECYPNKKTWVQEEDFNGYMDFSWVFFVGLVCFCLVFACFCFFVDRYKAKDPSSANSSRSLVTERERRHSLNGLGEKSVYRFFLANSKLGWAIALAVLAVQIWVLYAFVRGAEYDLNDEYSDLVYSWRCPRNSDECKDEADLETSGWVIFAILMASHLLKDIVNGLKLMRICLMDIHSSIFTPHERMRFFFGGMLLTIVTSFTLFVSTIYNKAIATSNTEIIINAVVILFVTDLDEQFFSLCQAVNPSWVQRLRARECGATRNTVYPGNRGCFDEEIHMELHNIKQELLVLRDTTGMLVEQYTRFSTSSESREAPASYTSL